MSLSLDDVRRVAHLARIEITDAETQATAAQLSDIFAMIERMQQIDTRGIEPMAHPLGGDQRLREDAASELIDRAQTMKNAPAQVEGLFIVPRVIE
jgi:aspartyl-tRNA(Asn)/glutamyl-tRNA(Gln) amidotransferase subunit C